MDEKLTKAAIIENLHNKLGLNRTEIHMVIDELFDFAEFAGHLFGVENNSDTGTGIGGQSMH